MFLKGPLVKSLTNYPAIQFTSEHYVSEIKTSHNYTGALSETNTTTITSTLCNLIFKCLHLLKIKKLK